MYHFEPIYEKDLDEITEILNYYVINSTVTFHIKQLSADEMREKVFFTKPYYKSFLIKEENNAKILGYCAFTQWKIQEAYRNTAEINIFLRPEFTAKGIGSIAITYLEAEAKKTDIKTMIAGICTENLPSIKLFEKNGYEQCADFKKVGEKFGRVLDVIYLQKFLR